MKNTKGFSVLIKQLKKLQIKDKEEFLKLRDKIMKDYDISQATLYRHLGKRVPGLRKTRTDAGKEKKPVPAKAKKMITELMHAGMTKQDALEMTKEKLGVSVSSVKAVEIGKDGEPDKTSFGSEAREFIRKILELDLIAPDAGLYFKHKGIAFKVRKEYIEDIALVLATAYNESLNGDDTLIIDREQMATAQLFHLFQEGIRIASMDFDMQRLGQLTKMHKDLKERTQTDVNTDFTVFEKCMKELRANITKSEIISLIKKHSVSC